MSVQADPIFVTGASGFIGLRVVKRLCAAGYRVRALVRRAPQEDFPKSVEVLAGDLTQPATYTTGVRGAWAVVHTALTDDLTQDVRATSELRIMSAEAGVGKFVHLSSIAVYGNPDDGIVTEDTRLIPRADNYTRTKSAIEDELRNLRGIPEIVVLRLSCVYGAGGGWWTQGLLRLMERGRLIVLEEGGTANLIHVEDVAGIVLLALQSANPPFDVLNVTDGRSVSWAEYFGKLEMSLGRKATVTMSTREARGYGSKWLHPGLWRRGIRKLMGTKFIHPLDDHAIDGFLSRAIYSNEKACRRLGFTPAYDLAKGFETIISAHADRHQIVQPSYKSASHA